MRIFFIGDIVGRPGRKALRRLLPGVKNSYAPQLVVANVENAASGFGLNEKVGREILESGVDVMTGGNHLWDRKGSEAYLEAEERLVRPANYPAGTPGRRFHLTELAGTRVAVLNLQGRVFMPPLDCPFKALDGLLEELRDEADVFLLDFHGEATSEKRAMALYADGRVSAVVGTHTHVPTADECILPEGTAFVSDLGMTGPYDSVIGMDRENVLAKFITGLPHRFEVASGDARLSGLIVDLDEESGRARFVQRVHERLADLEES
jgi:metallophosphoesterase (TIGR00282 family)